jgi:uncharacterized phage protein (TIGR02218 family)
MSTDATCWKITRADSTVLGFTDHDQDLLIDSVNYLASVGYSPSAIEHDNVGSSHSMEVSGVVNFSGISEDDLRAGLFDYATIECFKVNWSTLLDKVVLVKGWLGQVSIGDGVFNADLKGLSHKLHNNIGEQYMPTCAAQLGDTRCGLTITPVNFTVTASGTQRTFTASGLTQPDDFFKGGIVTFTSGANDTYSMDVKEFSAGVVELYEPLPNQILIGVTGTITQGCDGTIGTCETVFDNVVNFRGFPHLPGIGELVR